jgi:predicted transglutaminase-like cysteine proteinase
MRLRDGVHRFLGIFVAAVAALASIAPAQAQSAAPRMPLGRATAAPVGYLEFCAGHAGACGEQARSDISPGSALSSFWREAFDTDGTSALASEEVRNRSHETPLHQRPDAGGGRVPLTTANLDLLNTVNRGVNRAITPAPDMIENRAADIWSLPLLEGARTGDCEDYVLEKRRALAAAGLPQEALSIAVVRTRAGETHAVLLVDTDAGELVLDNRSQWIAPWNEVGYRWVKRQSPSDPARWVRIGAL